MTPDPVSIALERANREVANSFPANDYLIEELLLNADDNCERSVVVALIARIRSLQAEIARLSGKLGR